MFQVLSFLSLFVCWASASFLSGREKLPHGLFPFLLQADSGAGALFPSKSNEVFRTLKDDGRQSSCDLLPIDRTIALAAVFEGTEDEEVYIDARNDFFRLALGWNDERIERSRLDALQHFKDTFGLEGTSLAFNRDVGVYGTAAFGYGVFVLNLTVIRTADSDELVPCTNVTAVIGGWLMFGMNLTYPMIPGVLGSPNIAGDSAMFVFYLVAQPGTKFITKIEAKATKPLLCILNSCVITGDTQIIDDPDNMYTGNVDGISIEEEVAPGIKREYNKWVLTFPGRG